MMYLAVLLKAFLNKIVSDIVGTLVLTIPLIFTVLIFLSVGS